MVRRGLVIAAGWAGAVATAAAFGLATISALGAGAGPSGPLSQREVSERLTQASPTPLGSPTKSGEGTPAPSTTAATGAAQRQYFTTSGGGVWASCTGTIATLDSMTPRQGFRLDGYDKGPAATAWVRFKLDVRHGHDDEYQVTVTCPEGVPQVAETADV